MHDIRVELRPGNKLTWGYDNASPLYRVKVGPLDTLTFLTLPADLASMPRAGQVVEVHRWGSKLPNVEKVAEAQGQLFKVTTTYDPTTQQLVLDDDVVAQRRLNEISELKALRKGDFGSARGYAGENQLLDELEASGNPVLKAGHELPVSRRRPWTIRGRSVGSQTWTRRRPPR